MATITLRSTKGSALTNAEVDANFTNLNVDKAEKTGTNATGTWPIAISGNAATATSAGKWTTARALSFTGDATGSGSVDGSANVATALTLATTGVTAGSYGGNNSIPTITVDNKGRVTNASVTVPSGTWSISTSGNAATATTLQTARTINGVSFNGSTNIAIRAFNGSGNDYNTAGVETVGNGSANTVFPTLGFHQPSLYAASLQLRGATDFRFYNQGATAYANVTAATFIGALSGNASTATTATNQSGGSVNATTGAFSGAVTMAGSVTITAASGSEGGELLLAKPVSGTSFTGNVVFDVSGDKARIFASHNSTTKIIGFNFNNVAASTDVNVDMFPSGTAMLFAQTAAPLGWTKSTTHNDKTLRVVSGAAGSGGSVAFSTAFSSRAVNGSIANATAAGSVSSTTATNQATTATGAVGATTLSIAQIPSHNHSFITYQTLAEGSGYPRSSVQPYTPVDFGTGYAGGGGSHDHSLAMNAHTHTQDAHSHTFTGTAHNHTFTGTAIDLAVHYVDVIIATKD
jgi:hypothetical protein